MSGHKIHAVFHLAFVVKPIHNTKLMHDIDYNGTKNLLTAAYDSGVKHFIAISSTLAYGAHKDNPEKLTEKHPLRGNRSFPYGYNKAAVDNMIQDFAQKCPEMIITILRPCTVFGPDVDNYVSRMLFRPVTVSIRGYNPKVQFLHEDDFVKACLIAMEKRSPGIFNIVGEGTLTTLEIAEIIGTKVIPLWPWMLYPILEILWQLHFPGIEVNRGYLDYVRYSFVASPHKAQKQLGFYPEYTSAQTLKQAIKDKP
jgi:UDP-glucose 4-epimerase